MPDVFQGETMMCIMSGEKRRSNPKVSSGWDCIELDGKRYYVSAKWRKKSYKKIGIPATQALMLRKALELHQEGK